MSNSDYQAGREGHLTPPNGDWSAFERGAGDQQHWQANNDAVRRKYSDASDESESEGSVLGALLGLVVLGLIVYFGFYV